MIVNHQVSYTLREMLDRLIQQKKEDPSMLARIVVAADMAAQEWPDGAPSGEGDVEILVIHPGTYIASTVSQ